MLAKMPPPPPHILKKCTIVNYARNRVEVLPWDLDDVKALEYLPQTILSDLVYHDRLSAAHNLVEYKDNEVMWALYQSMRVLAEFYNLVGTLCG